MPTHDRGVRRRVLRDEVDGGGVHPRFRERGGDVGRKETARHDAERHAVPASADGRDSSVTHMISCQSGEMEQNRRGRAEQKTPMSCERERPTRRTKRSEATNLRSRTVAIVSTIVSIRSKGSPRPANVTPGSFSPMPTMSRPSYARSTTAASSVADGSAATWPPSGEKFDSRDITNPGPRDATTVREFVLSVSARYRPRPTVYATPFRAAAAAAAAMTDGRKANGVGGYDDEMANSRSLHEYIEYCR